MRRRELSLLNFGLALVAALSSLWRLEEADIYWQVRAGDELWLTFHFPSVDTWSYTAQGQPWLNIQWLSTLIFRAAFAVHQEAALVVLRALLVGCLFALLGSSVRRVCRDQSRMRTALVMIVCLAGSYLALLPRLQLRSDFLVLLIFAGLTRLWLGSSRYRDVGTVAAVFLAANLHAGTAPFVVLLAWFFLGIAPLPGCAKAVWLSAASVAYFATPYGFAVLPVLWQHVTYFDHTVLINPDHLRLSRDYLVNPSGITWVLFACVQLAVVLMPRPHLPKAYRHRVLLGFYFLIFMVLAYERVRAIPYQVAFFLPLVARFCATLRVPRTLRYAGAVAACVCMGTVVHSFNNLWDLSASATMFPIGATQFLQHTRPRANILHTFADGAYLVWYLRDYPVYADPREMMFWSLEPEAMRSLRAPSEMRRTLERYAINTVLLPLIAPDRLQALLPPQDWALVYIDKVSLVLFRRISEHSTLIGQYEHKDTPFTQM